MELLVQLGKIRAAGISNYSIDQLKAASNYKISKQPGFPTVC
nr:hypothetical protein [Sphingobacterium shayense]